MRAAVVVGMAGVPLAMLVGRLCRRYVNTVGIERRLEELYEQLQSWQAAHDHQVAGIDRRLGHVEEMAARAENEARIVAAQMSELNQVLSDRLHQIEHRVNRGAQASPTTGGCAVAPAGLRSRQVIDAGAEW
jgi:hypothetical protein